MNKKAGIEVKAEIVKPQEKSILKSSEKFLIVSSAVIVGMCILTGALNLGLGIYKACKGDYYALNFVASSFSFLAAIYPTINAISTLKKHKEKNNDATYDIEEYKDSKIIDAEVTEYGCSGEEVSNEG